jgi:hypothetical protein
MRLPGLVGGRGAEGLEESPVRQEELECPLKKGLKRKSRKERRLFSFQTG